MDYADKDIPSKEIKFSELKQAIDMIFNHIENDLNLKKIRLDHDYYASIGLVEKFEVLRLGSGGGDFLENIEMGLGQLYDDWEFLENMMGDGYAVALMFEHVAPILRYIGYKAQDQAYEIKSE